MGVMSRRVLPACGKLCFVCPSLRARSRQPVKRYKKFLADIFTRSQNGEPNDRMIGKLCEYASKNPMRIPKITAYLEQKCFKELRNEHFALAKVVAHIYRKFLSSCKEQMPLFAASSLVIVTTLLDQTRQDDMRILGCLMLVDFLSNQVDGAYMFNVEGLIPKVCQLCQEAGEDDGGLRLRSAGLQALAFMVQYMGDYSHVSLDFADIVSVTLDNYEAHHVVFENGKQDFCFDQGQTHWTKEARIADRDPPFEEPVKVISVSVHGSAKFALKTSMDLPINPAYWSRVCLHNMAKIAKEATTVRHILEPLFRYFDCGNCWSLDKRIACSVLSEMQVLMEKTGQNGHLVLPLTIKHLDHKKVAKQPVMQFNIVKIVTHLARHSKPQASVPLITAISDLIRHLRKCMHYSIEAPKLEDDANYQNSALHSAIEQCLVQLTEKVGDIGPILDTLAAVLENIPSTAVLARTTISSVYRTAQIAASLPNLLYHQKAFPEALFHQLLLAMTHPDHRTRVGSHRILSVILAPSIICPWSVIDFPIPVKDYNPQESLLVALSAFSSSWSIEESLGKESWICKESKSNEILDAVIKCNMKENGFQQALRFMRLSGHQVGLLLSSIWAQASSEDNTPANYEAMAHSFNLALWCSRAKNSGHMSLVRCFQLAFSLRSMSLAHENILQPSRRRSLYTLASSMLIFSAKAGDLPQIIPLVKATMPENMVDPHLCLIEDSRLHAISVEDTVIYGSEEDEVAASNFLAMVSKDDTQLKETVISHLMEKFEKSPVNLICIKEQLHQEFSPDDSIPLGGPLFMGTPHPSSPYMQKGTPSFDEDLVPDLMEDEDPLVDESGCQLDRKASEYINSPDVLSVNQLIASVLDTARQVGNLTISANPVPYDQMKSQCEALVMGKQQKMSVLLSFKHHQEDSEGPTEEKPINRSQPNEALHHAEHKPVLSRKESMHRCDSLSSESEQSFRLPPASPYDKFLKAAGW